jgi:DNA-directed RNA polymerase alpha subunit
MKSAGRKTCADVPPSELDLVLDCAHTRRCLLKAGISTLDQLRGLSRDDLLRIRGIGAVIAEDVLKALSRRSAADAERRTEGDPL